MKERLRRLLVDRVPGIRDRYEARRRADPAMGRPAAALVLLWLNIQYYLLFRRGLGRPLHPPMYEETPLYADGSESSLSRRESPEDFAARLAACGAVSFDVFDTLLFRPFSDPADLFYLVGMTLRYPDFRRIRIAAEEQARERKAREKGTREVTLEEIWAEMETETGIPREDGLRAEWEWEKRCCYPNPYMLRVFAALRRRGVPVFALSDMYLGEARVGELLENAGFTGFAGLLVSCGHGCSKADGGLYPLLLRSMPDPAGSGGGPAHVGDNAHADGVQAEKHGLRAFPYPNVQRAGDRFRPHDLSAVTGSIYRGLVNARLHSGLTVCSRDYEYGFLCGGLFAAGYCRFIHDYAASRGVDRLLFLSRDGALLREVYCRLYPDEAARTAYAYWSRLAAVKLTAGYYRQEYFRRFLFHKAGQGFSLRRVLEGMELPSLLGPLCRAAGLRAEDELTNKNAGKVKSYLLDAWDEVLEAYRPQREAGAAYYRRVLAGSRSAAAVDIGWAGSGAVMLDCAVNRLWGIGCPLTGVVAGTNAARSPEPDAAVPFFLGGRLVSYLYSEQENRDLWKLHDPARGHNLYWELLLGAPEGSLVGFYPDDNGEPVCRFRPPPAHAARIREIHRGALDFVELLMRTEERLGLLLPISGRDAYAPMIPLESGRNRRFMEDWEGILDDAQIG
ncbi:MAG TPA: hypothetical protein H9684_02125 [Firmicutes bacterium]|nr:hypothetical protein [Bacillota bacterium]